MVYCLGVIIILTTIDETPVQIKKRISKPVARVRAMAYRYDDDDNDSGDEEGILKQLINTHYYSHMTLFDEMYMSKPFQILSGLQWKAILPFLI